MTDLEQRLQALRPAAPSAALDRRLDQAFAAARRRAGDPRRAAYWWWLALSSAAAAAVALLFVAPRRPAPPPVEIVYHVEAQGRLRDMLLTPGPGRAAPAPLPLQFGSP